MVEDGDGPSRSSTRGLLHPPCPRRLAAASSVAGLLPLLLAACADKGAGGADTGCTPAAWYADLDGDGYGAGPAVSGCDGPPGHVSSDDDCDDTDPAVHPGATEVCNDRDDDCDLVADPPDLLAQVDCFADSDGDGYGAGAYGLRDCACPEGTVADDTDCDDGDPTVYPGAEESWYDGVDQDCDEGSDFDADGDGYAHEVEDCDDTAPLVHPGAEEQCGNGVDDDCDGLPGDCGYEGEVSSDEADAWLLAPDPDSWLHAASTTPDADGDGVTELVVSRSAPYSETADHELEFHVVTMAWTGQRALDDASIARFVAPTEPGEWQADFYQQGIGDTDIDGDGHADFFLGASNRLDEETGVAGRVYFEHGPAVGELDLSDAEVVVSRDPSERMGWSPMALLSTDGAGQFVLAVNIAGGDTLDEHPATWFYTDEHFRGSVPPDEAPALWFPAGTEHHYWGAGDVDDIDGDGVFDMLYTAVVSANPYDSTPSLFLGPFHDDRHLDEADATWHDATTPTGYALGTRICPSPTGGVHVAVLVVESTPTPASHHHLHEWTGPGTYDDDTVDIDLIDSGIGWAYSCEGDVDADGTPELALSQGADSTSSSSLEPIALLVPLPSGGTWELLDLPWASFGVPLSDADQDNIQNLLTAADLDGNGVDDLVLQTTLDRSWDDLGTAGRRSVLLRYGGERTGL